MRVTIVDVILFPSEPRSLRPSDGALLSCDTIYGRIEIRILENRFEAGWASLIDIPATDQNIGVLGEPRSEELRSNGQLFPPFQIMRESFRKGTPFRRSGRSESPYLSAQFARISESCIFDTSRFRFAPKPSEETRLTDNYHDKDSWNLTVWESGMRAHEARGDERNFPTVPALVYSVKDLGEFISLCNSQ